MRLPAFCTAVFTYVVIGLPPAAAAQVDQQRAQEFFKEAQRLCERDAGHLWGVSICAPIVIGDAQTQTFATSQPPPDAPRPRLIGIINGPIRWGDKMWAAVSWDSIANWPPRTRAELLLHESFHIVQPQLVPNGPAGANEHLDAVDGRYWLRLEWRALARALRESGELRSQAVRDALAFRQARHTRYPDKIESERVLYILEGFAAYTQTVLVAPTEADAIARGLELLSGAEDAESFVRTFTYTSGPVFVMSCGGGGTSNSLGAVVIPGAGTVYFNTYSRSGPCGSLSAKNGVLEASDGGTLRLPAPVPGNDATISGDGWTFKTGAGWVVREGARKGDYEVVRQQ
jgi:hypothetical protein